MVPRLLNEGQKEQACASMSRHFGATETEPNLLKSVVTGDES